MRIDADSFIGSLTGNSPQVLRDLLHISWKFSDPESGIRDQYVSLSTHHDGDVQISPLKVKVERPLTIPSSPLPKPIKLRESGKPHNMEDVFHH